MPNNETINNGLTLVKDSILHCGIHEMLVSVSLYEILSTDTNSLLFTVKISFNKLMVDDGHIKPEETMMDIHFNIRNGEYCIAGEEKDLPINYGNVFSYLFFNSLPLVKS